MCVHIIAMIRMCAHLIAVIRMCVHIIAMIRMHIINSCQFVNLSHDVIYGCIGRLNPVADIETVNFCIPVTERTGSYVSRVV